MPRTYQKRSDYWKGPRKPVVITQAAQGIPNIPNNITQAAPLEILPSFDGMTHYTSTAACGGGSINETSLRNSQSSGTLLDTDRYQNIRQGMIPLDTVEGNYSCSNAISLVYTTYFNYAILRNAINLLCDFSVGRVHVKTKNKKLKNFIETWFDAISLNQFQSKFFLEYYRSGNVFIYKFSGKISDDGFNMLKESYSSLKEVNAIRQGNPIIPIRYIILNPMQVYLQRGASYAYGYVRMLSTYEIERLKNPQTEEDQQIFKSFPKDIQRQIKQGGAWRWLFVPLDQNRLYYVFYRKQDYEPLAVPMAFPVLNDIEFKLNLRRIDTALVNSMEQAFMLVTSGRPADQWNQVAGAKNLQALQDIFQSKTIGRVLIADYTTKAEWKIPDLKDLLGPAKYERVEQDIKEGLQYMFFGEEKFANASIKIRIFIESLKEGRRAFIENFLLPEVKKVCEAMNFKNIPELEFEEIQIQDEALMSRLYVQLAQLGLLAPDETFNAIRTGMLPNKDESLDRQTVYKTEKDKGLYQPLMPGGQQNGRPGGSGGTPAPRQVSTPIGQKKGAAKGSVDEPNAQVSSNYRFGMTKVADNLLKMNELRSSVENALLKKWKIKGLNKAQQDVASSIARSIVFNEKEPDWKGSVTAYLKEPKNIPVEIQTEASSIAAEFDTDSWVASVLLRSKVDKEAGLKG